MARVVVAEGAGACFGVERALSIVERTIAETASPVYTLGPLIHNPQVVDELARQGVVAVAEVPADVPATLVIRSHGVAPEVVASAEAAGVDVVDATCPYVKKAQRAAARLAARGLPVLVVGEAGHPEVEGILGYATDAPWAVAVGDVEGLADLPPADRVGVVAQTTQSPERLARIADALEARGLAVEVADTICHATRERQEAARALAGDSEVMVVIGGRNSANTRRLAEICAPLGPVHHVESAAELEPAWFSGKDRIGVTAGASTPKSQIVEVTRTIEAMVEGR